MWQAAHDYEHFMGRWSRKVAERFVDDLALPPRRRWLDVGCGVGGLSEVVLQRAAPREVVAVDASPAFLSVGRKLLGDRVRFVQGGAEKLPLEDGVVDAAVSGLALNFFPDAGRALTEMRRVVRDDGVVAGYVWDYDHEDFFLTRFWTALAGASSSPLAEDERGRWAICSPDGLRAAALRADLRDVRVWTIDVETVFSSMEELWSGYLLGIGPSGTCALRLDEDIRARTRALLERDLPVAADASVPLTARAVAMSGRT